MSSPIICHMLIAPPGAGKSTLAQQWMEYFPGTVWVSTDQVREELYGDAAIQGNWSEIERCVVQKIQAAIDDGQTVLYDATNVRRDWRMGFFQRLSPNWLSNPQPQAQWIGWQMDTSLATCQKRNRQRDRKVPKEVILKHYNWLEQFPPCTAEGFAVVHTVPTRGQNYNFTQIQTLIQHLPQQVKQRQNRYKKQEQHPYSSLIAFERLLYLIAALMDCPGLGGLHQNDPERLTTRLEVAQLPPFKHAVDEISAFIRTRYGSLYADPTAIGQNLSWLQENGIINSVYRPEPITIVSTVTVLPEYAHAYSDIDAFLRIMSTMRVLAHYPIITTGYQGMSIRERLVTALKNQQIEGFSTGAIRRDIQLIFKPYGLMSEQDLRQGYFVGTGIMSREELLQVYHSLEGQAINLSDPIALTAYENFQQRLCYLGIDTKVSYPVRQVINQPITDPKYLSEISLAQPQNAARLEEAIRQRQTVRLQRISGTGRFPQDREALFPALPLQIVFYNIAWYLGYQRLDNQLFQFERIDRLSAEFTDQAHPTEIQEKAYQQLLKLQKASYGIFLGDQPHEQADFLSADPDRIKQVEATLEIWFNDAMFKFVSEGTQRFAQMSMSPRKKSSMSKAEKRDIFTEKGTGDPQFPHR
jgi:predicted kinase